MAWQKKALLHYYCRSRRRDIKLIIVNGKTNLPQALLHREASGCAGELHVSHVVTSRNNGKILIVLTISKAGQSYDKVHSYP